LLQTLVAHSTRPEATMSSAAHTDPSSTGDRPTETARARPTGPVPYARAGPTLRAAVAAIVLAGVFVVLAAQNSRSVEVHLLLWHLRAPLYGLAVVSALFGALVIEATGGLWRHRRQVRDREHRELLRLRRSTRRRPGVEAARSGRAGAPLP
jgi:uncharacterized integral membrane protein